MLSQLNLTKNIRISFVRVAVFITSLILLFATLFVVSIAHAQGGTCPANPNALGGQPYITVKVNQSFELVNIRSGPNSMLYDKIGFLLPGESAPALGRTEGGDWIEIVCAGVPGGVGWVYSANVDLISTGLLQVVDTPPIPEIKLPIDSTMVASFQIQPTATRLATFTPPPPTSPPPVYTDLPKSRPSSWTMPLVSGFALAGVLGLLFSLRFRR